jgi:Na+-translocating ferredoxin:NAD+ oxidoreductase RnfG subunit
VSALPNPTRALITTVLVAAICGLLLWQTASITRAPIQAAREAALRDNLASLAGSNRLRGDFALDRWPVTLCDGITLVLAEGRGYGGPIQLGLALQRRASEPGEPGPLQIYKLAVLSHKETPGIGDFIAAPGDDAWLARFRSLEAPALAARPVSLDAVSGATITVRAVRKILNERLTALAAQPVAFSPEPCAGDRP